MKVTQAKIEFNQQGTPISSEFDDVYYSNQSGIDETSYVFIQGNNLLKRWLACSEHTFTIAETGFGTGLNFLVTMKAFSVFRENNPDHVLKTLYFITTEKFPLSKADLQAALCQWSQLSSQVEYLLHQYPDLISGSHRLDFCSNSIILDLNIGDAANSFKQTFTYKDGLVDAWFLDGFAPSKNESMWTSLLFEQLARLSKTNATFATFTAAGIVKRGLRDAGFSIKKTKGFGRKRDMLIGEYPQNKQHLQIFKPQHPAYYRYPASLKPNSSVAIVGGGIAASILAVKLIQRGINVSIICRDSALATGASGNHLGGFYPQLNAEASINSQVQMHSFLYARRFYDYLNNSGSEFEHDWCGVLQVGFNPSQQNRISKLSQNGVWPHTLADLKTSAQASAIAKVDIEHPSLFLPKAGWISPPSLVNACIDYAHQSKTAVLDIKLNTTLMKYRSDKESVYLDIQAQNKTETLQFDALVIATGADSRQVCAQSLPFRVTRGQVEQLKASPKSAKLATVLCHKGYMTPSVSGIHALGSTYVKEDRDTAFRILESELNLDMHSMALPNAKWLDEASYLHKKGLESDLSAQKNLARAALRCSTPDHLPVAGNEPDIDRQSIELNDLYKAKPLHQYDCPSVTKGIYYLTGLGSRGLTTAPMLAELLASQMMGQALPLNNQLLDALNPNRFLVRSLIKRTVYSS